LVAAARAAFETAPETRCRYLRPYKRDLIDVFVSKLTLSGALDLASRFFQALEDRGHQVALAPRDIEPELRCGGLDERKQPKEGQRDYEWKSWRPARPTVVFIGTVALALTLYEVSENVEVEREEGVRLFDGKFIRKTMPSKPSPYSFVTKKDMPSGRLALRAISADPRASWERRWSELRAGSLASKFSEIAQELEREAPNVAKLVAEGEREAEVRRQQWEKERAALELKLAEEYRARAVTESREQLYSIIEAWAEAKRVEAFFEDLERRAATLDDVHREDIAERLGQARELLGGVDALARFQEWASPSERYRG
jgi:hypothetical protein